MIILGGGNWTMPLPRLFAQAIAIGVLMAAIAGARDRPARPLATVDWLVVAMLGLFFVHVAPMPPQLWSALPGRGLAVLSDRAVFGTLPWRSLSLDPQASLRSLLMLLPALATYLTVRLGDGARRMAMLGGALLAGLAGVSLAVAQAMLPQAEFLRVLPRGDYAWPVGFFANHNHQAIFLLCLLPLVAARLACPSGYTPSPAERSPAGHSSVGHSTTMLAIAGALLAALTLATASRSGAALLPLALAGTALGWRGHMHGAVLPAGRSARMALLLGLSVTMLLGVSLVWGLGGDGALAAFQRRALPVDGRFEFWPITIDAAMRFWPIGAGIGTFIEAYELYEPLSALGPLYLNHAHNDFLEILLEAGVPGLVLALVGCWELLRAGARAWRGQPGDPQATIRRMATLVLALPILHSLVDYPLRTVAISCLFALAAALVAPERDDQPDTPSDCPVERKRKLH
ncbi:MAG: O-antigen ligase family protein [Novosphingobium sp.]